VAPLGNVVTTIAGSNAGFRDGDGLTAQFREPAGLVFDPQAATPTLYVADAGNNRVRRIVLTDPQRPTVQTVAGTGASGRRDGPGVDAEMAAPTGLAFDLDGTLLVTCAQGAGVRRIDVRRSDAAVSTVWAPKDVGEFLAPAGITVDPTSRAVYMADAGDNVIRRMSGSDPTITPSRFTTAASTQSAGLLEPTGVATDPNGFLWVADTGKALIRKVTADGAVTTAAGRLTAGGVDGASAPAYAEGRGGSARFYLPMGLARHPRGFVVVADSGNHRIRKVGADGQTELLAGSSGAGSADGVGSAASFNRPGWVAIAPDGSVYVTDMANHRIRRIR
jgi:DNA-binding beta-propeller fold protein YncE